ncbi:MAG: hypothetical protein HXS52_00815 [Theionarchaea archaeon]|nr:hypothetical protein [Theionarchaea archaeon]
MPSLAGDIQGEQSRFQETARSLWYRGGTNTPLKHVVSTFCGVTDAPITAKDRVSREIQIIHIIRSDWGLRGSLFD